MHKPLFLITVGSVAAVGALLAATALPATAATSGRAEKALALPTLTLTGTVSSDPSADTPVTFTVTTTGTLSISAPTTIVNLGSGEVEWYIGSPGDFGRVTVTDDRGPDPAAWIATVSSTEFTNTMTSSNVLPADDAAYWVGDIGGGLALGLAYFTDLSNSAQAVVTQSGYDGDNAATWTPTIYLWVPATAIVGTYNGTVTHSVS